MAITELSLLAVFLTGLLGGVHCAGMCGGIVSMLGLLGQPRQKPAASSLPTGNSSALGAIPVRTEGLRQGLNSWQRVLLYNIGRISTYVMLGGLAGAVGSVAWVVDSVLPVQQLAYLLASLLMIAMGLYIVGVKTVAVAMESLGAGVWRWVRPAATRSLGRHGVFNTVLTGGLWGLVPCGLVYAVLGTALVSGSASQGALLMGVFGLGTLPNLMVLGLSGQWLAKASRNRIVRRVAGVLIMGFGVAGLLHLAAMQAAPVL